MTAALPPCETDTTTSCWNCGAEWPDALYRCPLCGEIQEDDLEPPVAIGDMWVRIDADEDEYGTQPPIYEGPAGDAPRYLNPGRYSAVATFGHQPVTVIVRRTL